MGITVIRFWNHEVNDNIDSVLAAIREALTLALSQRERGPDGGSHLTPSPSGRGPG